MVAITLVELRNYVSGNRERERESFERVNCNIESENHLRYGKTTAKALASFIKKKDTATLVVKHHIVIQTSCPNEAG